MLAMPRMGALSYIASAFFVVKIPRKTKTKNLADAIEGRAW